MALVEVKVPDIGDFESVAVIELLAKPGDTIKAEQSLLTVESDKASMEIPSSHAGVLKELRVKVGEKVAEGSVFGVIGAACARASPPPPPPPPPRPRRLQRHPRRPRPDPSPAGEGASPSKSVSPTSATSRTSRSLKCW